MKLYFLILSITIVTLLQNNECKFKSDIKWRILSKINEWKKKSNNALGCKAQNTEWQTDADEELTYPRGDKAKVGSLRLQWVQYYECLLGAATAVEKSKVRRLSAVATARWPGSTTNISCAMCLPPESAGEAAPLRWYYAPSLYDKFDMLDEKDNYVLERDTLLIYRVTLEDAGVYFCKMGASSGTLTVLEVFDENEPYNVVKTVTAKGRQSEPTAHVQAWGERLQARSEWGAWTECSRCGRVGRRARPGPCTLSLSHTLQKPARNQPPQASHLRYNLHTQLPANSSTHSTLHAPSLKETNETVNNPKAVHKSPQMDPILRQLFEAFPNGLPCRSRYLPDCVKKLPAVAKRSNEIMIGLCKVKCDNNVVFEVRDKDGKIVERANNSAGIFSLAQRPPPQPPPPPTDILFLADGRQAKIRCPGTVLRNVPYTWKVGEGEDEAQDIIPWGVEFYSRGRVYVTARDELVFAPLLYSDSNLYSCWQDRGLAGSVRVEVESSGALRWGSGRGLAVIMFFVAVVLTLTLRLLLHLRAIYCSARALCTHARKQRSTHNSTRSN